MQFAFTRRCMVVSKVDISNISDVTTETPPLKYELMFASHQNVLNKLNDVEWHRCLVLSPQLDINYVLKRKKRTSSRRK